MLPEDLSTFPIRHQLIQHPTGADLLTFKQLLALHSILEALPYPNRPSHTAFGARGLLPNLCSIHSVSKRWREAPLPKPMSSGRTV